MLNWDDLSFFRKIANERSFRRAAAKTKLSVNTIRTRIGRLEHSLGIALFMRSRDGLVLSPEGISALNVVHEMETTSLRLFSDLPGETSPAGQELRISCTEGIGESWLAPRLGSLYAKVPFNLSFRCDSDQVRIHASENDVGIGFTRPENPDTIVCKIATIHFIPCASRSYLERRKSPTSPSDLVGHRFITHKSYGLNTAKLREYAGSHIANQLFFTRMNTSDAIEQAIVAGLGIGALPSYRWPKLENVERVDLDLNLKSDLWLSFNRASAARQPIRDTIDWLKECFRLTDYPWFGDMFLFPAANAAGHDAAAAAEAYLRHDQERAHPSSVLP